MMEIEATRRTMVVCDVTPDSSRTMTLRCSDCNEIIEWSGSREQATCDECFRVYLAGDGVFFSRADITFRIRT